MYPDDLYIQYIDCGREDCSEKVEEFAELIGGLDLLVFSAGIGHLNNRPGYKVENKANKVNVLGFTELADWSYKFFEDQGHGHFVAITSMAGLFGFRNTPAYTAGKGYQKNYMEALRQRANKSKDPVFVTDIRAGFVDTEFSKDLKRFWVAKPEKAANQIFSALVRKKSLAYVTKRWRILAVVIGLIPSWARGRL